MSIKAVKVLFAIAAAYDIGLGFIFGLLYQQLYRWAGSVLPNHPGYVQLPALLIMVFGVGFAMVARDPIGSRSIMVLGVLMKLAFCAVVFYHMLFGEQIPFFIPFAAIDLCFAVLFAMAYRATRAEAEADQPQAAV